MGKLFKKIILMLLVIGVTLTSFANCFGKFALTRKVYGIIEGIGGKDWVGKIIRTLIMWVVYVIPIVAGIIGFIDIFILNLIEFWTDANPIGLNEYNKDGQYVRTFQKDGETLKFTYMNFGQKLAIDVSNGGKAEQFVVLRSEPGKIYKEVDNKLEEMTISSKVIGSKMVLRMVTGGKLESSKVIDVKDYQQLEQKYATETY